MKTKQNKKRTSQAMVVYKPPAKAAPAPKKTLSMCSEQYLAAISAPFSPEALGACIPRFPALRSQKVVAVSKFLMRSSTGGYGMLHVMPCLANNKPVAHYSNAGSFSGVGSTLDHKIGDVGTNIAYLNSPYTEAQLNAVGSGSVRGRIVSVGVRITPVANTSNLGGLTTTWVDPDHSNVNYESSNDVQNRPQSVTMRCNPKGHFMTTCGVSEDEVAYTANGATGISAVYPFSGETPYSTADTTTGGACMKFVTLVDASNAPYWVEIIQHIEFTGPLTSYSGSVSHVDPSGFAAVNSAAAVVQNQMAGASHTPSSYASYFRRAVASALREFTPDAASVGRAAVRGARYAVARLGPRAGQLALTL